VYESGRERAAGGPGGRKQDRDQECQIVSIPKREPCMGLVKDKELLARHRAQNTLAQLRTVARTVQVLRGPAHCRLRAGCTGDRAPLSPCCLPVASGAPHNGRSCANGILGRNRCARALRPLWPKTPSDRSTHNPAARTIAGIVPMEPSNLINCKKRAQKDVQMSSHARKYGEAGTPLNTSSCDQVAPAIPHLRACPAAPWPISGHLDKGLEVTARKQP